MPKKKRNPKNPGQVIIPAGHPNPPEPHEVDAAMALARHYKVVVEFIIPVDDYRRKSADILMLDLEWEIKCPKGASRATVENQFRRASKQSGNIIIDTRRTRLRYKMIEKNVIFELKKHPSVKKVVLIDKSDNIIEIQT